MLQTIKTLLKEIKNDIKQMGRYTAFPDWKN